MKSAIWSTNLHDDCTVVHFACFRIIAYFYPHTKCLYPSYYILLLIIYPLDFVFSYSPLPCLAFQHSFVIVVVVVVDFLIYHFA